MPDVFRDLVDRCQKGDREAQRQLYDALSGKMYAVCLRYVGKSDAADILQEGFVTLFEKLGSYKSEGSFEGWARRVFATKALMFLRKNDVLRNSDDIAGAYSLFASEPGPVSMMSYKEILNVMEDMPPLLKTVFNLYAIEDFSHKEIAAALGISEELSRTTMSRARSWLKARIQK